MKELYSEKGYLNSEISWKLVDLKTNQNQTVNSKGWQKMSFLT